MKKTLILGGTSGIGKATQEVLSSQGYKIAITGIETDYIKEVNDLNDKNLNAFYLDCIADSPSDSIEKAIAWLGGLDLLIFSAGIGNLNQNRGHEVENNANQLNVLAFTEISDWTYRYFLKQEYGHYVCISSISGLFGSRVAPAYHAAKAYQISYLEGLRQKANKSKFPIYITDIRPGYVDTPLTEGKKMFWSCSSQKAGELIYKIIKRKKKVAYVSNRWIIAACFIKILPKFLRDRL